MTTLPLTLRSSLKQKFHAVSSMDLARWLVLLGIVLRGILFFINQGLREDEGHLAINFVTRDFVGILQPLDHGQVAPPLFLLIEKALMTVFGQNEFSLRAFAFLSSCLALMLAYKFLKEHTNRYVTIMGVAFMSINRWLIFSAVAVKQYSSDVLILILLFYILFCKEGFPGRNRIFLLAIVGTIALWLSHISIFVLFIIGLYLLFSWSGISNAERIKIVVAGGAWLASFALLYFKTIANHPNEGIMLAYWNKHFMPLLPSTIEDLAWYPAHFRDAVSYWLGFSNKHYVLWMPYGFCFLLGIFYAARTPAYRYLLWFLPVFFVHLIVSGLKIYPFYSRLTLYLAFPFFLFLSLGIYHLVDRVQAVLYPKLMKLATVVLILLLMVVALIDFPYTTENIKRSLSVVTANIKTGDKVYVYYSIDGVFNFYKEKYIPAGTEIIYGKESRAEYANYEKQLQALSGRVWFVFSHIYTNPSGKAEDVYIIDAAAKRGQVIIQDSFYQTSVYLVDFKP